MKTKFLIYEAKMKYYGKFVNEGFLVAELEGKRLKNVEGVLTCDYVKFLIDDGYIIIDYYEPNDNFKKYVLSFELQMKIEDFELPIQISTDIFELKILEGIQDINKQDSYLNKIKELKNLFSLEESAI